MKHITINQAFIRLFALITLCFTAFSFTVNLGLDSYEIHLNKKLILKQNINQPLNLRVLQLTKANDKDQLYITYTHCNTKGVGTGRNIVIKDEKGNTLKKFGFADAATGSNLSMAIPAKELLHLEKLHANHELSIHYTAHELAKSEMLAAVQVK
ncbi:hypothetical protein [Pedobacter frigoris]|uniref:hypothetical protein n=1 Tax=Pedobacter frigoris TaxID=2571272 RepID=UPI00292D5299|nr:hypothetical protein [Pedobacter frigoris]